MTEAKHKTATIGRPEINFAFSALTLLVGRKEGRLARKKYVVDGGGGHWLVWPDGQCVCLC